MCVYRSTSVSAFIANGYQFVPYSCISAALLSSSISNLSTSAIGLHGKIMVKTEGGIPFPVYRSFSFEIYFNMCFHFQLLLAFGLVKILSSGVVISSHSPGLPMYSLSLAVILFPLFLLPCSQYKTYQSKCLICAGRGSKLSPVLFGNISCEYVQFFLSIITIGCYR